MTLMIVYMYFRRVLLHNKSTATRVITLLIQRFIFQLMHTTLKNVELLKYFKIRNTAPTCVGLLGNHHQGATAST